mgnify:CR=1 FL=1
MRTVVFDIETNGLLEELDVVHSLCTDSLDESYQTSHCADEYYASIEDGLSILTKADGVVGHNIIAFDIPAIQKVYPNFYIPIEKIIDTLILSRLLYPNLMEIDGGLVKSGRLPIKLRGSHGLEAWGYRLGLHKGDYKKEMEAKGKDPWANWNAPMQTYCGQDVVVNKALYHLFLRKEQPTRAIVLEHKFAAIIKKQEKFGFKFDVTNAASLYADLAFARHDIDEQLKDIFGSFYTNNGSFTPKATSKKTGYNKGVTFSRIKLIDFNPASRQHIADRLIKLFGWKPKDFTPSGQAQVDESILSKLNYPPTPLLARRFMLEKRISQIGGDNGWLNYERKGRIHGSVNTLGAVTGRCTHSKPNIGQVPSVSSEYGTECRSKFIVDDGYKLVGADASGLELRCLAHFMAAYDGGLYAKLLLEEDIHTVNQNAAGLLTRNQAKTFIYAFLYGAGDEKIGSIIGKGAAAGKKLKAQFLNQLPALKRLKEAVDFKAKSTKTLTGIDGRTLHVRHAHAALNTLLQSAGALLVKQATINLYEELERRGLRWGIDWAMVAHVHDEYQLQVKEEHVAVVQEVAIWSFREAGRQFNWRCPLDGDSKVGNNWAETH